MKRASTHIVLVLALLTGLAFGLTGCNLFDGLDSALHARTTLELTEEGDLALESADYPAARERFGELLAQGNGEDPTLRGMGETVAGEIGFQVLPVLDALQNGPGPNDKAPVCFRAARQVRDRARLGEALIWMNRLAAPDRPDRIARSLMKTIQAVRLLLDKYDTNHNRRLDPEDEIDFDTNDKVTPAWPQLYQDLIAGPAPTGETLEQAFVDLCRGFDGRGDPWTFLSPVVRQPYTGTFTPTNRATILAIGDLADRLEAANPYFEVNAASFAAAIRLLDGAD